VPRGRGIPPGRRNRPFGVLERHVVEDLDPVEPAVVDLVLDGLQQVVIADRVSGTNRSPEGLGAYSV
jgi:hypothetical protein